MIDDYRRAARATDDPELARVLTERADDLARDALSYCNSCDQPSAELDAAGYCPTCSAQARTLPAPAGRYVAATLAEEYGLAGDREPGEPLPAGATVEPWTDADTEELAGLMLARAHDRRDRWMALRTAAEVDRWHRVASARLTPDELATAAARFGIVADGDALPLNALHSGPREIIAHTYHPDDRAEAHAWARRVEAIDRQRETGDVWAGIQAAHYNDANYGAARTGSHDARLYETSDAFDERFTGGPVTVGGTTIGTALISAPIYAAGIAAVARTIYPKAPRDPRANTYRRPPEAPSAALDLDR